MSKKINYFTCNKSEIDRLNEALEKRNIDADSIINIVDNDLFLTVFYKHL